MFQFIKLFSQNCIIVAHFAIKNHQLGINIFDYGLAWFKMKKQSPYTKEWFNVSFVNQVRRMAEIRRVVVPGSRRQEG